MKSSTLGSRASHLVEKLGLSVALVVASLASFGCILMLVAVLLAWWSKRDWDSGMMVIAGILGTGFMYWFTYYLFGLLKRVQEAAPRPTPTNEATNDDEEEVAHFTDAGGGTVYYGRKQTAPQRQIDPNHVILIGLGEQGERFSFSVPKTLVRIQGTDFGLAWHLLHDLHGDSILDRADQETPIEPGRLPS